MLTFGSLFAGIGGFDLGFERAGMKCAWQVEIDDYATRVLEKHWPAVPRWRDVRTFPPKCRDWSVDVICGGFPCQDISYAGAGDGLDGERSGLFFEAIRVVSELRPQIAVLENVAALLTRGLDRVLGTLAEIGYDAEWHCIPAAAVGAPHIRDRVFVLAYSDKSNCRQRGCWQSGRQKSSCGSEAIVADTNGKGLEDGAQGHGPGKEAHAEWPRLPTKRHGQWWATEPDVGRVADGVPSRVDRLRGLGNAVVPQVAEFIGRQIVNNKDAAHGGTSSPDGRPQ